MEVLTIQVLTIQVLAIFITQPRTHDFQRNNV